MSRRNQVFFGVLVFTVVLLGFGPAAQAQTDGSESESSTSESSDAESSEEFQKLVSAGRSAYGSKNFIEAAEAFKKAYALEPVPNLLYNIGRVYEKAGEFEKAISYYEKFVNQPNIAMKNRQDALDRMRTLREIIALREEGKEVDDEEVEQKQSDRGLANSGGATKTQNDYTLAYVFLGSGIATLTGAGVFGILTANAHSDFQNAVTRGERRNAAEQGETYGVVADSLLVAGTALSGIGVFFLLSPAQKEVPRGNAARVVPVVTPSSAGLKLNLDF